MLRRAAFSPNIKERADCSAALFTADGELLVQAEHIPVHLGSMPASVAAAIDAFGGRRWRPATRSSSTTPSPAAPTSTTSPWSRPASSTAGWWAGPPTGPTTPTWAGWRRGRSRPTPPRSTRRGCASRRCCSPRPSRTSSAPTPARPTSAGATSTPSGGPTWWASSGWPPWPPPAPRSTRSPPTASGACGRPWPTSPTGAGPSTTSSTRAAPRPTSSARPGSRSPSPSTARRPSSTSPAPTPSGRGNVNAVEAVTVSAVAFALRSATDPTIPANGGALRPVTVIAPAGTLVAARPPAAVGAGNVEVSQRVADVCLGALAVGLARPAGRRQPGDDEQHPRRRDGLGVLRDRRRRPGRTPGAGGDVGGPDRA